MFCQDPPISERCCFAVIKPVDSIGAGDVLISLGLINSPFLQLSSSLDARLHRYRNLSPIFHLIYVDSQKVYPLHKAVKYQSDALIRSCVTSSLIGSEYDEQVQRSRVNFAIISFSTSANMSSLTLEEGYKLVKKNYCSTPHGQDPIHSPSLSPTPVRSSVSCLVLQSRSHQSYNFSKDAIRKSVNSILSSN